MRSSVTSPSGIRPSNVAALMNRFFKVNGPSVMGVNACDSTVTGPAVNFDTIGTVI